MKKLLFVTLMGVFCFAAVNTFTQQPQKKETVQEKTIRLETENKALKEQIKNLNTQVKNLDTQNKRLDARVKKLEENMDSLERRVNRMDYQWTRQNSCSSFCTGD
ncbi:MAG: DUF3450 family protein [Elusimicrobiaceae bacterium]|nr:DUF3450 family protein [Elusimicrobiaceae bacterium]